MKLQSWEKRVLCAVAGVAKGDARTSHDVLLRWGAVRKMHFQLSGHRKLHAAVGTSCGYQDHSSTPFQSMCSFAKATMSRVCCMLSFLIPRDSSSGLHQQILP